MISKSPSEQLFSKQRIFTPHDQILADECVETKCFTKAWFPLVRILSAFFED